MKNLTEGNIRKNFLLFAIPVTLSGMLSQAYSAVNTVIAGQFLGQEGLAATGCTSAFITLVSSVFWGYNTGVALYNASLFGAKAYRQIKANLIHSSLILLSALFAVVSVSIGFKDVLFSLLQVDPAIVTPASEYFYVYCIALFPILLNHHFACTINGFGDSKVSFRYSFISSTIHVILNMVAVTVLKLGVLGTALSSLLSALAVTALYIHRLSRYFREMGVGKVSLREADIRTVLRYALPTSAQQTVMYVAGAVLSPFVNRMGSEATAAYTVVQQVYNINATLYQNSSTVLGNYTAQCIGGRKYHMLKKGLWISLPQNILFMLPVLLICVLFPEAVCSLFFSANDAAGLGFQYVVIFLRFFLPLILCNVVANLFHHFYRGMGLMRPLLLATALGAAARIVVSVLLAPAFGIYGVFTGWAVSWAVDGAVGLILYLCGTWRHTVALRQAHDA